MSETIAGVLLFVFFLLPAVLFGLMIVLTIIGALIGIDSPFEE